MNVIIVDLSISAEEYLRHYQGVGEVIAWARDGRKVRFPADSLRKFVTHNGVHGSFRIEFSSDNRLRKMERMS